MIWFCSQKSSRDPTPMTPTTPQGSGIGTGMGTPGTVAGSQEGVVYSGTDTPIGYSVPASGGGETMLADGSYLAGLAMGDSPRAVSSMFVYPISFFLILFFL